MSADINNGELMSLLDRPVAADYTAAHHAGLESADPGSGPVLFHADDVSTQSGRQRRVGFVFQHYSLFRHMNIFDNIAFGLKVRPRKDRPGKAEIKERVHALLKLVQLERHAGMYPSQLSGGQRQRVPARSLAVEPRYCCWMTVRAMDAKFEKS
jgi:sulfate transport system ATP-binding protein